MFSLLLILFLLCSYSVESVGVVPGMEMPKRNYNLSMVAETVNREVYIVQKLVGPFKT